MGVGDPRARGPAFLVLAAASLLALAASVAGACDQPGDMLTFSTFHMDKDAKKPGKQYHGMIQMLQKSIKQNHPCMKFVLDTDALTQFPEFDGDSDVEIRRNASWVDGKYLNRYRVEGQFSMLKEMQAGTRKATDVFMVDSDILVAKPVTSVFKRPAFDVAATYRKKGKQPVNVGVLMVARHAIPQGVAFWGEWLKKIGAGQWYDDQKGFMGMVSTKFRASIMKAKGTMRQQLKLPGYDGMVKLALMECVTWNASPRSPQCPIRSGSRILHFKGNTKGMMKTHWGRISKGKVIGSRRRPRAKEAAEAAAAEGEAAVPVPAGGATAAAS